MEKKKIPAIIICNKIDLLSEEVDSENAKKFAEELGIELIETSAETGQNIKMAFGMMIEKLYVGDIDAQIIQKDKASKFTNSLSSWNQGRKRPNKSSDENDNKKHRIKENKKNKKKKDKTEDKIKENYKIILYGQKGVGKSTILENYASKIIKVNSPYDCGNKEIELNIFKSSNLNPNYIKINFIGAGGCFLLYDITNKESFEFLKENYKNVKENSEENIVFFVVGNKSDLYAERKVEENEGKQFADEIKCEHFEISAFDKYELNALFNAMAGKINEIDNDKSGLGKREFDKKGFGEGGYKENKYSKREFDDNGEYCHRHCCLLY